MAEKTKKQIAGLMFRYIFAILLSLNSFFIFYLVLTPLTLWPSYFLLSIFYSAVVNSNAIFINGNVLILNEACIAGSAYFLLAALNLTTFGIRPMKRIKIFLIDAAILLIFNILRIFVLSFALISGMAFYDMIHIIVWYVLSIAVVVLIWLYTIRRFKIKGVPVLSDILYIRSFIKKRKS